MPKRTSKRAKRTKGRREEILAAAAEIFAERGYAATGMDLVGEAAGITGGALYRHFDSKLDLFRALFEPIAEVRLHQLAEIAAGNRAPPELLQALVEHLLETILEDRSITAALWRELRHLDVRGESWFDRIHAFNTDRFAAPLRALRPDLDPLEVEARTVAVFGLLFSAAEFQRTLPRDELKKLLSRAALDVLLC